MRRTDWCLGRRGCRKTLHPAAGGRPVSRKWHETVYVRYGVDNGMSAYPSLLRKPDSPQSAPKPPVSNPCSIAHRAQTRVFPCNRFHAKLDKGGRRNVITYHERETALCIGCRDQRADDKLSSSVAVNCIFKLARCSRSASEDATPNREAFAGVGGGKAYCG